MCGRPTASALAQPDAPQPSSCTEFCTLYERDRDRDRMASPLDAGCAARSGYSFPYRVVMDRDTTLDQNLPYPAALLRLAGAVLVEQHDEAAQRIRPGIVALAVQLPKRR